MIIDCISHQRIPTVMALSRNPTTRRSPPSSLQCSTTLRNRRWITGRRAGLQTFLMLVHGCDGLLVRAPVLFRSDNSDSRYLTTDFQRTQKTPWNGIATLPPIIHYSAPEPWTKYEVALTFAKLLDIPHNHLEPDSSGPSRKSHLSLLLSTSD